MGEVYTAILAVLGLAAVILVSLANHPSTRISPASRSRSPLEEAERILTLRYARGDLSPEAYERALTVLRR